MLDFELKREKHRNLKKKQLLEKFKLERLLKLTMFHLLSAKLEFRFVTQKPIYGWLLIFCYTLCHEI